MVAETSLRDRRSRLLAEPGLRGQEFCRRYAAEADDWLSGLAERAAGDVKRHLALVAVGGYGRSSLCPYSDLDVVLVHNAHRDVGKVADAIWYPVWTRGFTSTTRSGVPPRSSARPPTTFGWRSACSTAGSCGARPRSRTRSSRSPAPHGATVWAPGTSRSSRSRWPSAGHGR